MKPGQLQETFARNYVERLVHYDWVAEHAPGTWYGGEALVYLGRTMDWLGDFGAAVRYYEELLRRHPEHAQTSMCERN